MLRTAGIAYLTSIAQQLPDLQWLHVLAQSSALSLAAQLAPQVPQLRMERLRHSQALRAEGQQQAAALACVLLRRWPLPPQRHVQHACQTSHAVPLLSTVHLQGACIDLVVGSLQALRCCNWCRLQPAAGNLAQVCRT